MTRKAAIHARLARSLALMAGLVGLAGCAGGARYVDVDSEPGGAVVYVDGERRGLTRGTFEFDFESSDDRVLLQVVKPGYRPVLQYWTWGELPADDKKIFVLEVD